MASYNQGDTVEFDPNTYTANNNISGGYPKCKLGSCTRSTRNWTLAYSGWNVNADHCKPTVLELKDPGKNVTWSVRQSHLSKHKYYVNRKS